MKIRYNKIIAIVSVGLSLAGCNSGTTSLNQSQINSQKTSNEQAKISELRSSIDQSINGGRVDAAQSVTSSDIHHGNIKAEILAKLRAQSIKDVADNSKTVKVKSKNNSTQYAYTINFYGSTISMYKKINNQLVPLSTSSISTLVAPSQITVDPSNSYVCVGSRVANAIACYSINYQTGQLTLASKTVISNNLAFFTFSQDGNYLYTTSVSGTKDNIYSFNHQNGSLSYKNYFLNPGGTGLQALAFDPSGNYLVIAGSTSIISYSYDPNTGNVKFANVYNTINQSDNCRQSECAFWNFTFSNQQSSSEFIYAADINNAQVFSFSFNSTTGEFTKINNIPSGAAPISVIQDQTGNFVYVVNSNSNTLSMYSIGSNGGLVPLTPASIPTGNGPMGITYDPTGTYYYVSNSGDNTISSYTQNSNTGVLIPVVRTMTGVGPSDIAIDKSGKHLYVTNSAATDNSVSMYNINANLGGSLSQFGLIATGNNPSSIVTDPVNNNFAYVTNLNDNTLSLYQLNPATGMLNALNTIATESAPTQVAFSPVLQYAYVACDLGNSINAYAYSNTLGLINQFSSFHSFSPNDLVFTPNGNYLYAPAYGNSTIGIYSKPQSGLSGDYVFESNFNIESISSVLSMMVSPNGKYAYLALSTSQIEILSIDQNTGNLSVESFIAAGNVPASIAIDPSGKYLYAANSYDATLSMYSINDSGLLTPLSPATIATGNNPFSVVVGAMGALYVLNISDGTISVYNINQSTGVLKEIPAPEISAGDSPWQTVFPMNN